MKSFSKPNLTKLLYFLLKTLPFYENFKIQLPQEDWFRLKNLRDGLSTLSKAKITVYPSAQLFTTLWATQRTIQMCIRETWKCELFSRGKKIIYSYPSHQEKEDTSYFHYTLVKYDCLFKFTLTIREPRKQVYLFGLHPMNPKWRQV